MALLKQLSKEIKSYNAFVQTILEKIEKFEEELKLEKRLGLSEADYYQNDTPGAAGKAGPRPTDTVQFQPTKEPIAEPTQHPNEKPSRIHLVYNPSTGRVEDAIKTGPWGRPPSEYMEANADQLAGALKHIERNSPDIAQKIVSGQLSVWIPRSVPQAGKSSMLEPKSAQAGPNKMQLTPAGLAHARATADKMQLVK